VTVPAAPASALRTVARFNVDEVILDLRSLQPRDKTDFTRLAIVDALSKGTWQAGTVAVQINPRGTRWFEEDLIQLVMLVRSGIACLVVPAEETEDIIAASQLLNEMEAQFPVETPIGLEARIETPRGVRHAEQIATVSPRLEALIFDSVTYARAVDSAVAGSASEVTGEQREQARSRVSAAARAHGLTAIEGPESPDRAPDVVIRNAERSRAAGFSGTWASAAWQLPLLRGVYR